jgi:hypothetical protein
VIETSREILIGAKGLHKPEATDVISSLNESIMADKEVGMAHSSVEDYVMVKWFTLCSQLNNHFTGYKR